MIPTPLAMMDSARAGTIGLTLFLLIFACVTAWALTRSRREIKEWSAIPLEDRSDEEAMLPPRREDGSR